MTPVLPAVRVIETSGLTKRFGRTLAVDRLTLSVEAGQIFGLLGPNGSGKTTTIGMLLGTLTPTSGEVRLFGAHGRRDLQRARFRIGATLETANFYPYLHGWDNLRIVARIKGVGPNRIAEVLETVGLVEHCYQRFGEYSLGMKQRLAIAATLLGDPDLVILDEPMNGLDPEGMREIRDLLRRLAAEGRTILLSTHLLQEVERSCTHVAILKHGRVIRQGSLHQLIGGRLSVAINAPGDPDTLLRSALEYPASSSAAWVGDELLVRLADADAASLNRFLAARGIYLSVLTPRYQTLEDAFMTVMKDDGGGPGTPLQPGGL